MATVKCKAEKEKVTARTKRNRVTTLIQEKKSRQEFEPLIGHFIDTVHIEPLHIKNNACQQVFRSILYESIAKSGLAKTVTQFDHVPQAAPLYKLVTCLQKKARLSRLAKKVIRWFNDTKGSGKDFQYRFTRQDSRMFLHNFMFVIDALKLTSDSEKQTFLLHYFAYTCLQLRQCVSISCRIKSVNLESLNQLRQHCSNYFRANCLFTKSVTPTVWNIGHLVPAHAEDVFEKYQLGLNVVSMEGRECKHMSIRKSVKTQSLPKDGSRFLDTNMSS